MESNYWAVINLLVSYIDNGKVDADELKRACFLLDMELDRCLVCNIPSDETKRLLSVLNGLYDKVSDYE